MVFIELNSAGFLLGRSIQNKKKKSTASVATELKLRIFSLLLNVGHSYLIMYTVPLHCALF